MDKLGRLVVVGTTVVMVLITLLGCGAPDEGPAGESADGVPSGPAATPPTTPEASLADLPVGDPPELAFVAAGRSVVFGDRSVDLERERELDPATDAVGVGTDEVLVYDADAATIHRVGPQGITLVTADATSPPVFGGSTAWIERDREIVQQQFGGRARQPLPDGCCDGARVVGYDVDIDVDIYVTAAEGSWMWDTYEGREGLAETAEPPADSEDHFWPVGGLDDGVVVGTGIASEVLAEHADGSWGWGYVAGPRDPSTDDPVQYDEQERVTADRVWLTGPAIVADTDDQLVVLASDLRQDGGSHHWRVLTGERTPFDLPDGLEVAGVVAENRRTVLVDATDSSGRRAWLRCHVGLLECAIATELGPGDLVPQ